MAELAADLRQSRDPAIRDTIDVINDYLETLARFREEKLLRVRSAPPTASPAERTYHAAIMAARAELERAEGPA